MEGNGQSSLIWHLSSVRFAAFHLDREHHSKKMRERLLMIGIFSGSIRTLCHFTAGRHLRKCNLPYPHHLQSLALERLQLHNQLQILQFHYHHLQSLALERLQLHNQLQILQFHYHLQTKGIGNINVKFASFYEQGKEG
ncbi:unnamed protein product [Linum trigynum]|uniref:Uncharacterized protein n=1 Tax=Linum trigynum TaxID=586398 RepID=A0AAV2E3E5_9ROSI